LGTLKFVYVGRTIELKFDSKVNIVALKVNDLNKEEQL